MGGEKISFKNRWIRLKGGSFSKGGIDKKFLTPLLISLSHMIKVPRNGLNYLLPKFFFSTSNISAGIYHVMRIGKHLTGNSH